jgi:hypothetical protein
MISISRNARSSHITIPYGRIIPSGSRQHRRARRRRSSPESQSTTTQALARLQTHMLGTVRLDAQIQLSNQKETKWAK